MDTRILIVDDDHTLLRFLDEYLTREGFNVLTADRGTDAMRIFYHHQPQLVLLDVMMPGMNGWEVCARIREMSDTPIVMLTAKGTENEKLRGFRLGVDDYVTKPFSFAELTARLRAVLARSQRGKAEEVGIMLGDLWVDFARREAARGTEVLQLTPTEFRLLAALARNPGVSLSSEELAAAVWGGLHAPGSSSLRRVIWLLRRKIEDDPAAPQRLRTVRGYGYRLDAVESSSSSSDR